MTLWLEPVVKSHASYRSYAAHFSIEIHGGSNAPLAEKRACTRARTCRLERGIPADWMCAKMSSKYACRRYTLGSVELVSAQQPRWCRQCPLDLFVASMRSIDCSIAAYCLAGPGRQATAPAARRCSGSRGYGWRQCTSRHFASAAQTPRQTRRKSVTRLDAPSALGSSGVASVPRPARSRRPAPRGHRSTNRARPSAAACTMPVSRSLEHGQPRA